MRYTTKRYTAEISVAEYIDKYVNVEEFIECCKECHNYEKKWSCPSYDFDVIEYWKKYETIHLIAEKIIFTEEYAGKQMSEDEIRKIIEESVGEVKEKLTAELYEKEEREPGSISLSAGSCTLCKDGCTRTEGKPCRYPDKMRYSIESLGGNVGMTISKLMGIELEWVQEGRLPSYFVLVCGIMK